MPEHTASSRLVEPALPGGWITQHRRIWQMKLLDANDLAQFSRDRGLSHFDEKDIIKLWQLGLLKKDIIKLWQLGLLKADLVESDDELLP